MFFFQLDQTGSSKSVETRPKFFCLRMLHALRLKAEKNRNLSRTLHDKLISQVSSLLPISFLSLGDDMETGNVHIIMKAAVGESFIFKIAYNVLTKIWPS